MAQPDPHISVGVTVTVDVTEARRQVRRLLSVTRDTTAELARLDEALTQLAGREEALAYYGIRLEVSK